MAVRRVIQGSYHRYPAPRSAFNEVAAAEADLDASSFDRHYLLAVFVYFFCNILLGSVAFALAVIAQDKLLESPRDVENVTKAKQYGHASIGVSVAGIFVGVISLTLIGILVPVLQKN